MNIQFGAIDMRLNEMTEEMKGMQETLATLPALRTLVDTKMDHEGGMKRMEEIRIMTNESVTQLKNDKASKSIVSSLETSQHRLVEEILALQKLIGCKIDRVEVPLLDVASEKLQFLLDFQITADMRLEKHEQDINTCQRNINTKESKDTFTKTMAAVREELSKKVDGEFIRDQVLSELHSAQDDIVRLKASEEVLDKLMNDYHQHVEKVRSRSRERLFA